MKRASMLFIMSLIIGLSSIMTFSQSASAHHGYHHGKRICTVSYDNCCNKTITVYKRGTYWVNQSYKDCCGCVTCHRVQKCYYYPVKRITVFRAPCNPCPCNPCPCN